MNINKISRYDLLEMSDLSICDEIRRQELPISIIGLGYVGLPLSLAFLENGARVIGADTNGEKISFLKQGKTLINTLTINNFSQYFENKQYDVTTDVVEAVRQSKIHIICVSTPLDNNNKPALTNIQKACMDVGKGLKNGDLVVFQSSVFPGLTSDFCKKIIENKSKLKAGIDFGLAYCIERIDPGNVYHRLENTPRVIGGINDKSANSTIAVFRTIIKADILKVKNCKTAEMVKVVENIYRDVNIAYINEIALLCEKMDIDVLEVLAAASSKWSFHPHLPGAGVGGSCIPINPYYLLSCAEKYDINLNLVRLAREINESMPHHTIKLLKKALIDTGKNINGLKVTLLGIAYKPDVDDTRGSVAITIGTELEKQGAEVIYYDPLIKSSKKNLRIINCMEEALFGADCIIVTTAHSIFNAVTPEMILKMLNKPAIIIDGRHIFRPLEMKKNGIIYNGIGRSKNSSINIWDIDFIKNKER